MSQRRPTNGALKTRETSYTDRPVSTNVAVEVGKHLKKTKMCSLFMNGKCHYGEGKCFYAHTVEELRAQPPLARTSFCALYKRNKCVQGDNCRYAHSMDEMAQSAKRVVCLWYSNGHCSHGANCRFSHVASSSPQPSTVQVSRQAAVSPAPKGIPETETGNISIVYSGMEHNVNSAMFDIKRNNSMESSTSTNAPPSTPMAGLFSPVSSDISFQSNTTQHSSSQFFSSETYPETCSVCGSIYSPITLCICKVFEECSELLRLL